MIYFFVSSLHSLSGWCFFPIKILAALREDKAHLAAGLLPATSTIRRQEEASQALAFRRSLWGSKQHEGCSATWPG